MNIRRKILLLLLLLGILGVTVLFWRGNLMQKWHQAEKPTASEDITILKAESRHTDDHSSFDTPPSIENDFRHLFHVEAFNYEGPQTVERLLERFQEMAADAVLDERYPQEEWLQRVLARGYTIEDWEDYAGFLTARRNLLGLEDAPKVWASGRLGIPPTNDFQTYKAAYMDRKIWEYAQLKDAKLADPQVNGGFFKDDGTFFPFAPQRVYVERAGTGAAFIGATLSGTQKFELLTQGVIPEGYEVIYINNEGKPLAEPPPLLSRESVLANTRTEPVDPAWGVASLLDDFPYEANDSEYHEAEHTPATSADAAPPHVVVDALGSLEALDAWKYEGFTDDADIEAELQKMFTAEGLTEKRTEPGIQSQFSPELLNRAMNTLKRYGPKEGMERIRAEDPKIAAQIENSMRFNSKTRAEKE